jgi:hypothetical protein
MLEKITKISEIGELKQKENEDLKQQINSLSQWNSEKDTQINSLSEDLINLSY